MSVDPALQQYRLDNINEAKKVIDSPAEQQKAHHKLWCVATYLRLSTIVGDMLANPRYTSDYADALKAFVYLYIKLRDVEDK